MIVSELQVGECYLINKGSASRGELVIVSKTQLPGGSWEVVWKWLWFRSEYVDINTETGGEERTSIWNDRELKGWSVAEYTIAEDELVL